MSRVEVSAYDPEWPRTFERIRAFVWPAVQHAAMSLEHVGSTSVPGLRAKPVVDACIVVASRRDIPHVVKALTKLGVQVEVLGPAEAPLAVIRGRHRFRLLVQAPRTTDLQGWLRAWLAGAPAPRGGVRVQIDIDPQSFL